MTARQIIQEIETLSAEEQSEIKAFLLQGEQDTDALRYANGDKAMAIADKILTERAELFERLAQ
jgi:hypothetical protein